MNKNKPDIRFRGFTDDWKKYNLGEITERIQGNDGRINLPTLTISAGSGWLDQRDRFYKNIAGKEQSKYTLLKKGQLSYNHGNSKLAKYGAVFELQSYKEALVPHVYHSFKTNNKAIAAFIEYEFATKRPDKELSKLISSGARMDGLLNISFDDFMKVKIIITSVSEQIKISIFFRYIDHLITMYQNKCDKLKDIKKAMLEKMFPKEGSDIPEIRFKGFTDAWKQCYLNDITKITMGQSPSSKNYTNNSDDNILVQGNADMKNGCVIPRVWTTQVTKTADVGDLIISVRAPVGEVGKTAYKVVIGRGVAAIKGNEFIFQSMKRMNENGYWRQLSAGSTFDSINSNDLMKAILLVTNYKEETKIGEFFKYLDSLISLYQCKYEKLKNIKKAMLQKMFV